MKPDLNSSDAICASDALILFDIWRFQFIISADEKDTANRSLKSLLQQISESKPTMANNKDTLMQKYITILMVVALYWWESWTLIFLLSVGIYF